MGSSHRNTVPSQQPSVALPCSISLNRTGRRSGLRESTSSVASRACFPPPPSPPPPHCSLGTPFRMPASHPHRFPHTDTSAGTDLCSSLRWRVWRRQPPQAEKSRLTWPRLRFSSALSARFTRRQVRHNTTPVASCSISFHFTSLHFTDPPPLTSSHAQPRFDPIQEASTLIVIDAFRCPHVDARVSAQLCSGNVSGKEPRGASIHLGCDWALRQAQRLSHKLEGQAHRVQLCI
jgi:hypothetical protein